MPTLSCTDSSTTLEMDNQQLDKALLERGENTPVTSEGSSAAQTEAKPRQGSAASTKASKSKKSKLKSKDNGKSSKKSKSKKTKDQKKKRKLKEKKKKEKAKQKAKDKKKAKSKRKAQKDVSSKNIFYKPQQITNYITGGLFRFGLR
jgi:hypothetical protein